jgi:uncharacterized protein (DUF1501 family)
MHLPRHTITRHDFLDGGPGAAPGRVLVVVFLRGGADGLTLVPPVHDDLYRRARPVLAVQPAQAIDLDGYFALHAALRPLVYRFEAGDLAIVHGAGSEDETRSHFEAQDTMEHGGARIGSGWLARFLRASGRPASALSAVAIGTTRPESLRGAPAGAVLQTIREFSFADRDDGMLDRLARLYAVETGALGAAARDTVEAVRRLRALRAENAPPENGAAYPPSWFGRGLREIARLIKADIGLEATTIDLDGWDTHFVQASVIDALMRDLAEGLDAFVTDLGAEAARVTVVVMTEFGRRLRENTSFGTDHGAGAVMLVLESGAGAPGRILAGAGPIHRPWPDLGSAARDDVGDVPVLIDYRDVLAPVLRRHAPDVDLGAVFPAGRGSV